MATVGQNLNEDTTTIKYDEYKDSNSAVNTK